MLIIAVPIIAVLPSKMTDREKEKGGAGLTRSKGVITLRNMRPNCEELRAARHSRVKESATIVNISVYGLSTFTPLQ